MSLSLFPSLSLSTSFINQRYTIININTGAIVRTHELDELMEYQWRKPFSGSGKISSVVPNRMKFFSVKIEQFLTEHFYCEPNGSGLLTMVNLSLFSSMILIKFSFDASVVL